MSKKESKSSDKKKTKNKKEFKLESIECKEAKVKARRVLVYNCFFHEKLKELVYSYTLNRGATTKISGELSPKKPKIDNNAKLNLGDKIAGNSIECITPEIIRSKLTTITSKHKGKFITVDTYVYCRVLVPRFGIIINQK